MFNAKENSGIKEKRNSLSQFHPNMSIITSSPPPPPHKISICWAISLITVIPTVELFADQSRGQGPEKSSSRSFPNFLAMKC